MNTNDKSNATWRPRDSAIKGRLSTTEKNALPASAFAFPEARKEPMLDAAHVRNALSRFDQVKDVTNADRDLAFANIQKAAKHFEIQMTETNWHEFGARHTG